MSEPANTTTTSAPTTTSTTTPAPPATWPRRLLLTGRVLVTIGAVGFTIFTWAWWWRVEGETFTGPNGAPFNYVLLLTPGDIAQVSTFFLHVATVLGLIFLPFLWLTKGLVSRLITMNLNLIWLGTVVATLIFVQFPSGTVHLIDGLTPAEFSMRGEAQHQFGFWIAIAALVVWGVGTIAMEIGLNPMSIRSRQASTQPPARPRLVRLPAAGGLTLGLIFFLIGILGMGWTAVNCTDRPLFLGQCHGLTFTGVLHYGISTQTDAFDPIASRFAIPALLVGGATLVLIGLWWWRRLTPGFSLWITLYLGTATFFYLVAYAGTGAIALHSTNLGLESGTWTAQSGLWVAALGLLFGWLALIPLWFRVIRPAPTASESPAA